MPQTTRSYVAMGEPQQHTTTWNQRAAENRRMLRNNACYEASPGHSALQAYGPDEGDQKYHTLAVTVFTVGLNSPNCGAVTPARLCLLKNRLTPLHSFWKMVRPRSRISNLSLMLSFIRVGNAPRWSLILKMSAPVLTMVSKVVRVVSMPALTYTSLGLC